MELSRFVVIVLVLLVAGAVGASDAERRRRGRSGTWEGSRSGRSPPPATVSA